VANARLAFKKCNGNMGSTGSVVFMFDRQGVFKLKAAGLEADDLELELIDFGLEDMERSTPEDGEEILLLRCGFSDFGTMQTAIEERGLEPLSSESEYTPQNTVSLSEAQMDEVLALVDRLEQDDDVQRVFHNLA
jgi:transcriptional/translational regulatory protein YebC/TACO1